MRDHPFETPGFLDPHAFERDVILTGTVLVRVFDRKTAAARAGERVVLRACGFV